MILRRRRRNNDFLAKGTDLRRRCGRRQRAQALTAARYCVFIRISTRRLTGSYGLGTARILFAHADRVDAGGIDPAGRQEGCHRFRSPLRQAFVVMHRAGGVGVTFDDEAERAQPAVLQRLGELVEFSARGGVECGRIQAEIDQHIEAGFFSRRVFCLGLALALFLGADADSSRLAEIGRAGKKLHDVF